VSDQIISTIWNPFEDKRHYERIKRFLKNTDAKSFEINQYKTLTVAIKNDVAEYFYHPGSSIKKSNGLVLSDGCDGGWDTIGDCFDHRVKKKEAKD